MNGKVHRTHVFFQKFSLHWDIPIIHGCDDRDRNVDPELPCFQIQTLATLHHDDESENTGKDIVELRSCQ